MSEEKKTAGQLSLEALERDHETRDPIALQRAAFQEYESMMSQAIEQGIKKFDGDFFVIVIVKAERLMRNVLRNMFYTRESCPTPTWDQSVYKYHRDGGSLEFIWVVPDRHTCKTYRENAAYIVPEEQELLKFVLDFEDGSLLKRCNELNGEISGTIILEK